MDYRNRFSVLYFDGMDFFKRHFYRFVAFAIFLILGIIIGIWYGASLRNNAVYIWSFDSRLIKVITHSTSLISYFFWLMLETLVLAAIITVLSLHYFSSFLSHLVFLYRGYVISFNAATLIITAKLSCIPFVVLCYIPFALITLAALICFAVKSVSVAHYAYCSRFRVRITETLAPCLPIFIILILSHILEAILTMLLISGIVIS